MTQAAAEVIAVAELPGQDAGQGRCTIYESVAFTLRSTHISSSSRVCGEGWLALVELALWPPRIRVMKRVRVRIDWTAPLQ